MQQEKPLADLEYEKQAKRMFDVKMSPEEYVARKAHMIGCSSFDEYSYRDRHLQNWIYEFHRLLRDPKVSLDELRARYLTPQEIEEIKKRAKEDF